MNSEHVSPQGSSSAELASRLELSYTSAIDLTLAQLRKILSGLAAARDDLGVLNAAAVSSVLNSCAAGHLPLASVALLVDAVEDLPDADPATQLSLKRLEELMSRIN